MQPQQLIGQRLKYADAHAVVARGPNFPAEDKNGANGQLGVVQYNNDVSANQKTIKVIWTPGQPPSEYKCESTGSCLVYADPLTNPYRKASFSVCVGVCLFVLLVFAVAFVRFHCVFCQLPTPRPLAVEVEAVASELDPKTKPEAAGADTVHHTIALLFVAFCVLMFACISFPLCFVLAQLNMDKIMARLELQHPFARLFLHRFAVAWEHAAPAHIPHAPSAHKRETQFSMKMIGGELVDADDHQNITDAIVEVHIHTLTHTRTHTQKQAHTKLGMA